MCGLIVDKVWYGFNKTKIYTYILTNFFVTIRSASYIMVRFPFETIAYKILFYRI